MILGTEKLTAALQNGDVVIERNDFGALNTGGKIIDANLESGSDSKFSHKISLHIGPLIRVLSQKPISGDSLFQGTDGIIDLSKCGNKYILEPHESVGIYSREKITLSSNLFGLVLPKVKNFYHGGTTPLSYVDPMWEGVLELIYTNHSENAVTLHEGQPLANLIILTMDGDSSYRTPNRHYAYDWARSDHVTELPWKVREKNNLVTLSRLIRDNIRFNFTSWIIISPLVALWVVVGNFFVKLKIVEMKKYKSLSSNVLERFAYNPVSRFLVQSHLTDIVFFMILASLAGAIDLVDLFQSGYEYYRNSPS